ncbi:MAG: MGMT family protein [Firmicutes bacterium]|nr:MGMT family protein [Bacillota bacterium]
MHMVSDTIREELDKLSPFARAVLAKVAEIPRGSVRPYWWVAREIGVPRAARAVGNALAENPLPIVIPCHRVVRSDWSLGGYCRVLDSVTKRNLLSDEGVDLELLGLCNRTRARFCTYPPSEFFCLPTCGAHREEGGRPVLIRDVPFAAGAGLVPCGTCRPDSGAGSLAVRTGQLSGRRLRLE